MQEVEILELTSKDRRHDLRPMVLRRINSLRSMAEVLSHDVPVVWDVVRQSVRFNRSETCLLQVFARLFFAPHGSQTFSALRQRNGHATHARDSVKKRADRMREVVVDVAGGPDVLHQVDAVALEGAMNALQDIERLGLIVNGIEGRDEVKSFGLGGLVEIPLNDRWELHVAESFALDLLARGGHRLPR